VIVLLTLEASSKVATGLMMALALLLPVKVEYLVKSSL